MADFRAEQPNGTQLKFYWEQYNENGQTKNFWGEFVTSEVVKRSELDALKREVASAMQWKESVANFAAIATKYPTPEEGWTVSVNDTNEIFRYDEQSSTWKNILSSVVLNNANSTADGLMSKEHYNWITNFTINSIQETALRKFVSQEQINKWNNYVQFPGFGGNGLYFGVIEKAARSDHQHETLANVNSISFKNTGTVSMQGVNINSTDTGFFITSVTDNSYKFWFNYKTNTAGVGTKTFLTNADGLNIDNLNIDNTWKNKLKQTYQTPSFADITGKPSTYTPSAHTHTINEISNVHSTWHAKLTAAYQGPNFADIPGKPTNGYKAAKHLHSKIWAYKSELNKTGENEIGFADLDGSEQTPYLSLRLDNVFGYNQTSIFIDRGTSTTNLKREHFLTFPEKPDTDEYTDNLLYRFVDYETGRHKNDYIALLNTRQNWRAYQDFLSGAGNTGSDMRFKTNIKETENVLDDVCKLEVFEYDWTKQGEEKNTFGISASQLLELGGIFEKMVHERQDEEKTKWVEYDRFGVLAIKALQEYVIKADERIEYLEREISALKEQIQKS